MLREFTAQDAAFRELCRGSQARFATLVAEAQDKARAFYQRTLGRPASIEEVVDEVFTAVERDGDDAVARYASAFDGATLDPARLRVSDADIAAARSACDPALIEAIAHSARRVADYQQKLVHRGFGTQLDQPLGCRWTPLARVGAYIPGGAAGTLPLFSSVVMNLVPALVAGVSETVLVTPPRRDGSIAPELLAAAAIVGVPEIYRIGGIPAIAALACGTRTIRAVDKIVGPGNIVVTLAKRRAYGRVDLDMLAGPSEVLIIADRSADPRLVAADLLSQAEHDVLAMAICVAIDGFDAPALQREIAAQLDALPSERQATARASIQRFGALIRVADAEQAAVVSDAIAPEHLELLVEHPKPLLARLRHAGAIFVGPWSPEPIGDYIAGPSHTLPTGGTARMWSGIGADTFLRRTSIINFSEADFRAVAADGLRLARGEGLEAHARSIAARLHTP